MAVSEPIVVEAISSFVDQMVVTAKQPNAGEKRDHGATRT